jgi:hypothetical protein
MVDTNPLKLLYDVLERIATSLENLERILSPKEEYVAEEMTK